MKLFLAIVMTFVSAKAFSGMREDLSFELQSLFKTLEKQYAPLQLKKSTIGLDWPSYQKNYLKKIKTISDSNEYYFLVADIFNSLNDAHVSVVLPTNYVQTIPLQFSWVNHKVILSYYNERQFRKISCGAQLGDELVAIEGRTLDEIQKSSPAFRKFGNDITNHAYFSRMLTGLREASGIRLGDGKTIKLSFKTEKGVSDCQMDIKSEGVRLIGRPIEDGFSSEVRSSMAQEADGYDKFKRTLDLALKQAPYYFRLDDKDIHRLYNYHVLVQKIHSLVNTQAEITTQAVEKGDEIESPRGTFIQIGATEPFYPLPYDFKEIQPRYLGMLLNAQNFYAGTFMHNGKRVGYLRIPSYAPDLVYTIPFTLRFYINRLEQESDLLVIDQMNNPGGYVIMSDLLVKALTGKYDPNTHLRFAVKPTQNFLRTFAELKDAMEKDTELDSKAKKVLLNKIQQSYDVVYAAYKDGKNLSDPISLLPMTEFFELAVDSLVQKIPLKGLIEKAIGGQVFSEQVYTKPIYFMINELDFSGGDATPATLQDYQRVKLVGVRTAGAGGSVEEFQNRLVTEFKYRLTTSLMVRKDGGYVENYGVHPDIPFTVTEEDYKNGFKYYFHRFLTTVVDKN